MRGGEEEEEGRSGENLREGEQLIGEETREEEREEGRLATESVDPKFTVKSIWMKFEPSHLTITILINLMILTGITNNNERRM